MAFIYFTLEIINSSVDQKYFTFIIRDQELLLYLVAGKRWIAIF